MSKISDETIKDWIKNEQRIKERLLKLDKKLKKFNKQKKHFEMRMRLIKEYIRGI